MSTDPNRVGLELRRALGWGLVYFFLGLTGRDWEDLPIIERSECWLAAESER